MSSRAQNLDIHTDFDPALHHHSIGVGLDCFRCFGSRVTEQGGQLHTEAADALDARIYVSMLAERSVWLDGMTDSRVLVYVGHSAAVGVSWWFFVAVSYNMITRNGVSVQFRVKYGRVGSKAQNLPYSPARHVKIGLVLSFVRGPGVETNCFPCFLFIGVDAVNCDV